MNNIIVGLPSYNSGDTIVRVIEDIKKERDNIHKLISGEVKILVVDDYSSDNTLNVLNELDDIVLVGHESHLGLGMTINTIFKEFLKIGQDGDILVIMDCDSSHNAIFIKDLLVHKRYNIDLNVVICSRFVEGSEVIGLDGKTEVWLNRINKFTQKLLNINSVTDYYSNYRLYDYRIIRVLDTMASNKRKDRIVELDDTSCMLEIIYKISKMGGKFREIPFIIGYNGKESENKINISYIFKALLLPIKLKLKS